ncbi:beta-phosphoglucomutase family hydrolase [Kocuria rosea]|uniref:beta-phosphoglucomutase family hydrolase n=3 Tax=Micrococcaceae TaxID=1268 RepID=UPI001930F5A8|nr:beta-phosphoglucomutase family hydrolase [Kocuria rosea]
MLLMRLEHLVPALASTDQGYRAVIFDMDGVVTDTAGVHARAWKALFDEILPALSPTVQELFDADTDYRAYLDGRPRRDGVRTFLAARGLSVPEGGPGDGAQMLTVHGLAARKQELFAAELTRQGVRAFPDALVVLRALVSRGVPTALVTSSRNSASVLEAARVGHLFTVRVDGTDAHRLGMPGKPDPAVFLEAARRLEVAPAEAVVIEDSTAGVTAAAAGGFGQVVGVDRTGNAHELTAAGAHLVVEDLRRVPLVPLAEDGLQMEHRGPWCGGAVTAAADGWRLVYDRFDPVQEGTREALCTLGNGYWATRGAVPGSTADGTHYPGTYFAGVYNRRTTDLAGHQVETEHLVNAPDWTYLSVRPAQGTLLHPGCPEMIAHHQVLDLRHGVLTRTNRYRDATGHTTRVTSRQLHSLARPYVAALEVTVEAEDWSGELIVESTVNSAVSNRNVIADRELANEHWGPVESRELDAETVLCQATTTQSGITVATAARTRVFPCSAQTGRRLATRHGHGHGHEITLMLRPGQPVTLEKTAVVATSRDRALSTPALDVGSKIDEAPRFALLLAEQGTAWAELWDRFGIDLEAGAAQELALNLHLFHVLQTVAATGPDLDAGLPARGLHGEGYRGHIFWDELFVYPMLTLRRPELTRSFLLYRYRRLGAARAAARQAGLEGALFPWQSGSDGREETPTALFNVRNGQWMPDNSHRQRHVGLAVAYSVWQYYQATDDIGFLTDYGAEMIIEVARLVSSLAVHDPVEDRFDITGVMGPDEYHDGYPDAPGQGVRNNTYTNVLAAWVLARAGEIVDLLAGHDCDPLWRQLHLQHQEIDRWNQISRRVRIPWHADGVISQFEGYEDLEEFDWAAYRARYGNIGRLDLILQAEGDSTNRYKLSKQADVLMLFYLFSAEELRNLLARLGYTLPPELIPRTIRYYLARTSHGSTLSRLAHGWVLARTDRARSWALFEQALQADLADTQGGTTREGVHLGAMAGTADMVMRCYGGVEIREEALWLHPVLPDGLGAASFQLRYRGQPISISLSRHTMAMRLHPCSAAPIRVCAEGLERTLRPGQVWEVPLTPASSPAQPGGSSGCTTSTVGSRDDD